MTVVSAPAGSGKTVLLRSWISESGLAERAAWVTLGRDEPDPQRFWLSALGALRRTSVGSALVRELTAAPNLDGWMITERLLKDLAPLKDRLWLVIDDLHELGSDQARRQLELLVMRAPAALRFVLASRHDVRLGLHRLRLEGELTEIRADDLRFAVAEARALFVAAGVDLPSSAVAQLVDRTEGWAAGLRLAALSLARHPDPKRFAEEFSGTERTVAEYLLAEVLDRQGEDVRRLLLRTSVLERVNGELADLLTGGSGGERMLQDLEEANAFVVSLDAARSWFRYHHLFADLLQLELRHTEPGEVTALHELGAGWLAGHGYPVEAIRHAQAAQDWGLATRLLADHWLSLYLDGRSATVHALMAGFPAGATAADAELVAVAAGDELAQGSLEAAEWYLGLAERESASVPEGGRGQAQVLLGVVRLLLVEQSGNQRARAEQAERLLAAAVAPEAAQPGLSEELRASADQPRRLRDMDSAVQPGTVAPGAGGHASAADRAAISRVHGSGVPGADRALSTVSAGGRAQQAGDRAGRAPWLDRRSVRRPGLQHAWIRAGLAGQAGRGRALGATRRAYRQGGNQALGGDGDPVPPRAA